VTAAELVSTILTPLIAVAAIIWANKGGNKQIEHDDKNKLWEAINQLDKKLNEKYWGSERVQEYFKLSTDSWTLRLGHIEQQQNEIKDTVDDIKKLLIEKGAS